MAKKSIYTPKGYKTLQCSTCFEDVRRVSYDAAAVVCWKCTIKSLKKYETIIGEGDTR